MTGELCPDRDALLAFQTGELPEGTANTVIEHLCGCTSCQAVVGKLNADKDPVAAQLRVPPVEDPVLSESACRSALARAKSLPKSQSSSPPWAVENGPAQNPGKRMVAKPSERPLEARAARRLGDYELFAKLGEGGMGTVFKAVHTKLDRVVAVKILARQHLGNEEIVARFDREMKAIGRLNHPSIVQAYDARESDGVRFLVMEYVDGEDFSTLVERHRALPIAEACELIRQAAEGLQYVHQHGMVHRDVKPSNLMLSRESRVKILDLGLARLQNLPQGREITSSGQVMGTPDFMSPEQFSDSGQVDIRSDVYSLGCALYKLLTGQAPFDVPEYGGNIQKFYAHLNEPVPPIRQRRPEVPDELAKVLDRMLAKDFRERYATPGEAAQAIQRFARGANLTRLLGECLEPQVPPPVAVSTAGSTQNLLSSPIVDTDIDRPAPASSKSGKWMAQLAARRWKPWEIGAAVATLATGLVLALGIIITIKRGDRETTIEVPEGSRATLREDGSVQVVPPDNDVETREAEATATSAKSAGAGGESTARSANPDRRAAERVLEVGGTISLLSKGKIVKVSEAEELPHGAFTIREVDLRGDKRLCNEDLRYLEGLEELGRLDLTDTQVSDEGLIHIQGLTCLLSLRLSGTRVTDRGLECLKGLHKLQAIGLNCTAVTGSCLQYFQNHPALRVLELVSTQIDDQGLQWLRGLPNLNRLEISHTRVTDAGFANVKHLRKLQSLYAGDTRITDAGLEHLAALEHLEYLQLSITEVSDSGLRHLSALRNLQMLFLKNTAVGDEGLRYLQTLAKLEYLSLARTRVTDEGLRSLAANRGLKRMELHGTEVTPAGAAALKATLPNCDISGVEAAAEATAGSTRTSDAPPLAVAPLSPNEAEQHQQRWAKYARVPAQYTGKSGVGFTLIPPGTFHMGSPENEVLRGRGEKLHEVTVSKAFYMATGEVTRGQFAAFVDATGYQTEAERQGWARTYSYAETLIIENRQGASWQNPGFAQDDSHPVTCICPQDAEAFCEWLSTREGRKVSLPTEAQWEYACRAGTTTPFHTGQTCTADQANIDGHRPYAGEPQGICRESTTPTGTFPPSFFGLHDMHGNVGEICCDWYDETRYLRPPYVDPEGPEEGFDRVFRGGSWSTWTGWCRSASRGRFESNVFPTGINFVGFRVVMQVEAQP